MKIIDWFRDRMGEHELFETHNPRVFPIGSIIGNHTITRHKRISDTALFDGGRMPCWQVFGRKGTEEMKGFLRVRESPEREKKWQLSDKKYHSFREFSKPPK
jgi:hypothetical protein